VNEINYHMKSVTRPISRISFIGHSLGCILIRWGTMSSIVIRYRVDAGPDPTFHFNAVPDPDPTPGFTYVEKSEFFCFTLIHTMPVRIRLSILIPFRIRILRQVLHMLENKNFLFLCQSTLINLSRHNFQHFGQ
jgi:hypothetical protein